MYRADLTESAIGEEADSTMAQSSQLEESIRSATFSAICLSFPTSWISSIEKSESRSKTSTSMKSSGMKCLSRSSKKSMPMTATSPLREA